MNNIVGGEKDFKSNPGFNSEPEQKSQNRGNMVSDAGSCQYIVTFWISLDLEKSY